MPSFVLLNRQRAHPIPSAGLRHFIADISVALEVGDREFAVVFVSDREIREHNLQYRGYDKPTDVLSFRSDGEYLGDIVISAETAYNQARRSESLDFAKNIRRLILHGLLHLLGMDHETDQGQMRRVERRMRDRFKC